MINQNFHLASYFQVNEKKSLFFAALRRVHLKHVV